MTQYAVVGTWTMDPTMQAEQDVGLRDKIVPMVSQAPGFVEGRWTRGANGADHVSFLLFDAEPAARQFADQVRANGAAQRDAGVHANTLEVYEVIASA